QAAYSLSFNSRTLSSLTPHPVVPEPSQHFSGSQAWMPMPLYLLTPFGPPSDVTWPTVASPFRLFAPEGSPEGMTSTQVRNPVKPSGTGGTSPGSRPLPDKLESIGFTARP